MEGVSHYLHDFAETYGVRRALQEYRNHKNKTQRPIMKSTEQHLAQLRRRTYQRQAESAQMRANLRKMRAAEYEREAEEYEEELENLNDEDPNQFVEELVETLRERAEDLRVEADNILEDWKAHQEDKYFEKLDPYVDQREHTELIFVPTDQENSKLIVMIDTEADTHIRSQSAQ